MGDKTLKNHCFSTPTEQHETAAWAEIERIKKISKVTIPSDVQVRNAKDYVDGNQK